MSRSFHDTTGAVGPPPPFGAGLAEVRLSDHLTRGEVSATVQDPKFKVPTAVAAHGHELALVNARFDLGLPPPIGPGRRRGRPSTWW